VEFSELVLNLSPIMMSKIVKAIDVEVNKRLEEYLVTFIKYNYENGSGQNEGFVRPSDEEIASHISSYVKMTPFSLEEKVVDKKRMGRPKKNEKETIVAAEEEMFGNLAAKVSELNLEHPNDIAPIADAAKPVKEKKEKAPKVPKEKIEKAPKVPKEKVVKEKVVKEKVVKEKVVKEKKEKVVKEKKQKVVKAAKNEEDGEEDGEEENPWAINDDGVDQAPKEKKEKPKKEKVVKEKKEKVVKEKKEKVVKEGGEEKKRGRPKKGEEPVQQVAQEEEDTEEEDSGDDLPVALNKLSEVASVVIQKQQPSHQDDDEVVMEEYEEFEEQEEATTPQTDPQDHLVKFTDKNTGKDYFIDKQMQVDNDEEPDAVWYAVKDAGTRKVVGRSNLRQMELFEEDDEDDEEEEEEEEEEEDADNEDD